VIRRATSTDHHWIRTLAADVYRELGDYWTIIGSWLDHPGVLTYLDEGGRQARGFILLGFYQPRGAVPGACVADLLAIAVAREHQRQGLGRRLLEYAIQLGEAAGERRAIPEIRLTVADTNLVGQKLFRSLGFTVLDQDHGHYDGGQRAIRMSRPLGAAASSRTA
jgi:ribosomal protein S18 acetylase RimI-like enzyme